MAPRLPLAAVLLSVCIMGAAAAGTCPVCVSVAGITPLCLSGTVSALALGGFGSGLAGATTCPQALGLITCGTCSSGGACACTSACANIGTAGLPNLQLSCTCAAAGTVCADPHFTGAFGVHYDFHGLPDRDFNLITDQGLALNAHFIGQDGLETGFDGTWMAALGLVWTEGSTVRTATLTVKQGSAAFEDAVPFEFEIDGQALVPSSFRTIEGSQEDLLYEDESLSIGGAPLAFSQTVTIKDHLTMIVTAATHENPAGNHLDIALSKLNVTGTVHGALGQTFAAARADALKAAAYVAGSGPLQIDAADIIEGKDVDYMTSSLLSTDFMYNRFNPSIAGVMAKLNVLARKLLGQSSELVKHELQGDLSCKNLESGGIRCSK